MAALSRAYQFPHIHSTRRSPPPRHTLHSQGLFYHEGMLYESTGIYGKSSLRQVDWPTGKVKKRWSMNARLFGEGCVWWKGDIIVLTWQARKLFVLDGASFTVKRSATFSTTTGQGWGITHNGSHLIVSDGSANLHFWDPDTLKEVGKVTVKDAQGVPQSDLNELEFAGGEILANTWFHNTRFRNQLLRIHPTTGRILGSIDCAPVLAAEGRPQNPTNDVLNGIAVQWDAPGLPTGPDPSKPLHGLSLFITGKLWNHVYKVSLSAT